MSTTTTTRGLATCLDCDQLARWTITTLGHPGSDGALWYCSEHVYAPTSDLATRPYSIRVEGPHEALTVGDVQALSESAEASRRALGVAR